MDVSAEVISTDPQYDRIPRLPWHGDAGQLLSRKIKDGDGVFAGALQGAGVDAADVLLDDIAGHVRMAAQQEVGLCAADACDVGRMAVGNADASVSEFDDAPQFQAGRPVFDRRLTQFVRDSHIVIAEDEPEGQHRTGGDNRGTRQIATVDEGLGSGLLQYLHGNAGPPQLIVGIREDAESHVIE